MMARGLQKGVSAVLVPIESLRPHEKVMEEHVRELMNDIMRDGKLIYPIIVDRETMIILDGHHRVEALRRLGARYVPAILVNYRDNGIKVRSWKRNQVVSKEDVIKAGIEGKLLPPKTSRHITPFEIPEVNVPLHVLFGGVPHVLKAYRFERGVQEEGS